MNKRLRVHLGRDAPKSVELEESSIEVTDDFVVIVENHGPPQHIHVAPAEDLVRFVTVDDPNHFIGADDAQAIRVSVADQRPEHFNGHLRIVTGYGTEETFLEVGLRQEGTARSVRVDESLGVPRTDTAPRRSATDRLLKPGTGTLLALAAMAVLVAIGAILLISETAILLGALTVLVGVGIAIALLVR